MLPEIPIPDILPENLTMDNPHYEGFGKDGSAYAIKAATAQQDLKNTSLIKLNAISGVLTKPDKKKTELTAARGVFNHTENVLELEEAIDINADSGLKAKLTRATVQTKEGLITSNEPVLVEFPGGSVQSNTMTLRQKAQEITFADARESSAAAAKKEEAAEAKPKPAAPGTFAASDAPVDITAQRLDIKDGEKIALFTGEVMAVQGDAAIATPELEVHYSGDDGKGRRSGARSSCSRHTPAAPGAGKVNKINAKGPVTMTRGAADRVTCDARRVRHRGLDRRSHRQRVMMSSGADRRATSDRADLDSANDTTLLTGNVVVNSGKNELEGPPPVRQPQGAD